MLYVRARARATQCLNESPSEKEGKCSVLLLIQAHIACDSMKVPPKRKGKSRLVDRRAQSSSLNESPSEKEGKHDLHVWS